MEKSRAFYLNAVPGYREALTRAKASEFRSREDSWLALPATIAGRKVRVMTVRDYVALLRLKNPFVMRTEPTFEQLGELLWVLSPEIERWHNHTGWRKPWLAGCRWPLFSIERWQIFLAARRMRKRLKISALEKEARIWNQANPGKIYEMPEASELAKAIKAAFAYIDRLFLDRPAGIAREGTASGLLYLTSWFDRMQSEYHKPDAEIWMMPLPVLFCRLKAIQERKNPGEPEFNGRQDAVNAQLQAALQKKDLTVDDVLAGKMQFKNN